MRCARHVRGCAQGHSYLLGYQIIPPYRECHVARRSCNQILGGTRGDRRDRVLVPSQNHSKIPGFAAPNAHGFVSRPRYDPFAVSGLCHREYTVLATQLATQPYSAWSELTSCPVKVSVRVAVISPSESGTKLQHLTVRSRLAVNISSPPAEKNTLITES